MGDLKPTEKVQAGGYAGAAAILVLYLLDPQGHLPPLVSAAITLLIAGAGAWIKTEGTGWLRLFRRKRGEHVRT
jgi:hypothetical protein